MIVFSNLRKNFAGTASFHLQIKGMKAPQDFCVYPMSAGTDKTQIRIQSDKRFGRLDLTTGKGQLTQSHSNGAYAIHMITDKLTDFALNTEQLESLKAQINGTASASAGIKGVMSFDNSNAQIL